MKISVIIPVYNVEKCLNRCVDSVLSQKYTDLEVILVDDGSPDNSPKVCDEYAKLDTRVKVVHKNNGGLSDARNFGLNEATGEYVSFLDSDDYFLQNFSWACEVVKNNQKYDVITFGDGIDKFGEVIYPISACMKFFRLDFLNSNNIRFTRGIYHEDVPFSLEVILNTNKILSLILAFVLEVFEARYVAMRIPAVVNPISFKRPSW